MRKLVNFLAENFPNGVQMFNTRNTVGDYVYTVFHEGDIIVDLAPDYGYIEIFGLTQDEFDTISNLYDGDSLWDVPNLPEVE